MTIKTVIRFAQKYRKWLIDLAMIVTIAVLTYWLFAGYAGRREVGEKIDEIKTATAANERRVDAIIDAAKAKEVAAKHETAERVGAVSDDTLPDLLSGLLAEWRREHGH